jgi:hypothetical protein
MVVVIFLIIVSGDVAGFLSSWANLTDYIWGTYSITLQRLYCV